MGVFMTKKILFTFLIISFLGLPLIFFACCADEQCSEEDTYGKTVLHKTDTVFKTIPKLTRGPMSVQIGAFANEMYAERFTSYARTKLNTTVNMKLSKEGIYRITIGEYNEIDAAREILKFVKSSGYNDAFIRDEFGEIER